jgi:tetratricopeptide (TPR) repeat protein
MPKVELYLDEADRLTREEDYEEATKLLSLHLEEHEYSQEAKRAVSWRFRDISERLMEKREFLKAFDYYDSHLNLAKAILSPGEYKSAIVFIIDKCKWVIDVQTGSSSFDIAKKYFERILEYGGHLKDTRALDEILNYIVEKYLEEMKRKILDRAILESLRKEADRYIGMIGDKKVQDGLRNRKIMIDDKTKIY